MQRYWWPGYEMQLLGALQRQQNNAQFCDTLLQTEGISVPTHRCILAALSPYLSEKLLNSPSPPSGHKRQLRLQAVKPQTLLKLVGLLYSGEVEVKGSTEQNDVLSAACQFGITGLVERPKDGGMKEGEPLGNSCGSCRGGGEGMEMQDAVRSSKKDEVQAEMAGRRAPDCPVGERSCVSTGTQTDEKTTGTSLSHSSQTKHPTREPETPVAEDMDSSLAMQPQNLSPDEHSCSTSVPSGAPSKEESTLNQSSYSVTNPTSTSDWPCDKLLFPVSLNEDSNSLTPHEDSCYQQSPEFGDRIGTGLEDEKTNAKMTDQRGNTEQPSHTNRDEKLGEEEGISTEKKRTHTHVGVKSLAKMKKMHQIGTTKISIKLKRRTKGEVWEVVSVQDGDEPRSALTSLKQTDLTNSDPSSVQPSPIHKPKTPVVANSPEAPPLPSPTSDSQPVCSESFISNQNSELESVSLARSPGPVEESDEYLEKLLEDIMIGLNILPNSERDCKESHHLQMSHDGALAICQIPVTENERAQSQTPAAVSAAGCVDYQDYGTQHGHSSADTAQNQPSIASLPSVQSYAVLVHQLQQHSTVTSMGKRDGASHQDTPLSKSQTHPFPEAPTESVIPKAFHSSGQTQHYPACPGPSAQDDQDILEFLPLSDGNEVQSSHSMSLPRMDDLRLPPCLSPLQQFASAAKHQPPFNNWTSQSNSVLLRPSHVPPWLTGNSVSLQFPLGAMTHRESVSLPQDTKQNWSSKQQQKFKSPPNRRTRAESCTVTEVGEGGTKPAGHQTCQQSDTKGDTVAPRRRKRKCASHPQDASYDLEVTDGTKTHISLSICSVSLSSNNVLSKQREMATTSSDMPSNISGEPDELSAVTQSLRETTRGAGDLNAGQTLIRTRSLMKKKQHTPGNARLDDTSGLRPVAHRTKIVNKQGVSLTRPKRGRPPKVKHEESPLAISEKKSPSVESEQQLGNNLSKEDEKTKMRCKKRRRNRSEAVVIPPKKPMNADMVERDDNKDDIPAVRNPGTWPQRVSLKEFQKLIKRQHSKTRKSKEKQDNKPNEPAKDAESEEKACELNMEPEMDISQPQNSASHTVFNATVDENHNLVFNESSAEYSKSQGDNKDDSSAASGTISLFADDNDQLFSSVVFREEAELAAEREQPLKNLTGAQKALDAGVSDTTPPQENNVPLDHKLNPLTLERSGPPLPEAVELIKSSGCDQEEEEMEGEVVDVDTLLNSPEKVSQSREEEEEEEEDEDEIDVVGD